MDKKKLRSVIVVGILAIVFFTLTRTNPFSPDAATLSEDPSLVLLEEEKTDSESEPEPTETFKGEDELSSKSASEQLSEAKSELSEEQPYYWFSTKANRDEHFEKHKDEFEYATAKEYLDGANRVINDPAALKKTEAEDGDYIFYLEASNEIVFLAKDGDIRTYFKPEDGIDYYNRQ